MPNEVQTVSFSPMPTAGTYTLSFYGQTTDPINWNDSATTIQSALEALSNIGSGNIAVNGEADTGTITLTFQGALANTNLQQTTCDASGLPVQGTIGAIAELTVGTITPTIVWDFSMAVSDGASDNLGIFVSTGPPPTGTSTPFTPTGDDATDQAALQSVFSDSTVSVSASVATIVIASSEIAAGATVTAAIDNWTSTGQSVDNTTGTAEVQLIPAPTATGGDFGIFDGISSNNVAYPFTTAFVQGCLDSILGANAATVSGADGGPWTLNWNSSGPQPLLTIDGSELTSSVAATVNTTQDGGPPLAYGSVFKSTMISCPRACA